MARKNLFQLVQWILFGGIIILIVLGGFLQFRRLTFGGREIDSVMRVQRKVVNRNSSADACSLDSESMWGPRLHKSPFLGLLKHAYEELTHTIFTFIKENPVPCESVTILVNLFPSVPIKGRQPRPSEQFIYKYTGQAGCGILVLSDWYVKLAAEKDTWSDWLYADHRNIHSWHVIPFATDDLVKNISFESKANEVQRFVKLLKAAAPLYVPQEVLTVIYADAKCILDRFVDQSHGTDLARRPDHADIVTLAHPDLFGDRLKDEFINVRRFMAKRGELPPVLSDIDRLENFLGPYILNKKVDLADIKCMSWQRSDAVETFARRWFWYIATFSMRGQLSWNPALFDCGEGLWIKYFTGCWPEVLPPTTPQPQPQKELLAAAFRGARARATVQASNFRVGLCRLVGAWALLYTLPFCGEFLWTWGFVQNWPKPSCAISRGIH